MAAPGLLALVRSRLGALLRNHLKSPAPAAGLERYVVTPALGDDAGALGAIALACQLAAPGTRTAAPGT